VKCHPSHTFLRKGEREMIKKVILGTTVALVLTLVFVGRDAWSYVRTSLGYVKDSVHESVPIAFQIERARQMIKDLDPEVRKNMHLIAKEEVEVERLQKQVTDLESRLAKEEELKKLHADAKSGKTTFQYGGRKYGIEEVRADLSCRFERLKTGQATLKSLREICTARSKSLDAARQKLEGMLAARRQLKVDVENLEARMQMIAAAQTTSNYHFDDSQLGRVKELVNDLRTRLDVTERLVGSEATFHDEIPVSQPAPANIVEQVGEYFAKPQAAGKPDAVSLAKSK
jgi:peptidoglycan hydrolase CwlO-like protein